MFNKLYSICFFVKKWHIHFIFCVILTLNTACQTIFEKQPHWLGLWTSTQNGNICFIEIADRQNQSFFEKNGTIITYGRAKLNEDKDQLSIADVSFDILTYPYKDTADQKWKMQLDTLQFVKN